MWKTHLGLSTMLLSAMLLSKLHLEEDNLSDWNRYGEMSDREVSSALCRILIACVRHVFCRQYTWWTKVRLQGPVQRA